MEPQSVRLYPLSGLALRNHRDLRILHDRLDHFNCSGTDERSCISQGIEEFGEDGFCCEQATVPQG